MSSRHRALLASTVVVVALTVSACGPAGTQATAGADDNPRVVTALYPIAFVADRVGGDDITLANLAAPGVEPHDLELAPQQVGEIADAALVVYLSGFAPAVDEAVEQNAADRAFDVGSVVSLIEATASDPHGPDESSDDEPAEDHDRLDPHFWLDPHRLGALAVSLADRLGEIDPESADAYTDRAADLVDDLEALDESYAATLASCDTSTIVTAHASFGYLAERYGLEQFSVAGLEPDAEPSAARIAEVHEEVVSHSVTTVYFEPLTSSDVVDSIASDLGLDTAELDPIESVSEDKDYLTVMTRNLATLKAGQGCT